MKKFLITALILSAINPVFALAQTQNTATCQQLYGPNFVYNGSTCVNSTVTTGGANTQTSPNTTTGSNLGYTPLEPIPGITSGTSLVDPNQLPNIINAIFKILITVGALIAVLSLTIGGVQYMVSGSAGGKNAGMKRAQAAVYGILVIAASWLILNTINPQLLKFNLNPCPQGGTTCTVATSASNNSGNSSSVAGSATAASQCTGVYTCPSGGGGACYCNMNDATQGQTIDPNRGGLNAPQLISSLKTAPITPANCNYAKNLSNSYVTSYIRYGYSSDYTQSRADLNSFVDACANVNDGAVGL